MLWGLVSSLAPDQHGPLMMARVCFRGMLLLVLLLLGCGGGLDSVFRSLGPRGAAAAGPTVAS